MRADTRMAAPRDDRGVAMILVMAWGLLMMGIVLVVSQMVINQIRPSEHSEDSYAALAAAEAGLADLQARIQVGTITSVQSDSTNLALKGWVPVPGGNTKSEFTYAIDGTKSGSVGEVRAYSTGRANGVVRTVESVLSKRSTLDYVYMSDKETPAPDTPGVYSTTPPANGTDYGGRSAQDIARVLCTRRWYESGPVTIAKSSPYTVASGNQRNMRFCKWAGIFSTEQLIGRVHTNDIWWLENTNLGQATNPTLQAGFITSSCRSTEVGLGAGEVGCPQAHRFIATNDSTVSSTTTDPTVYQGDAYRPPSTGDNTTRNPGYDTVLDLPPNPDTLRQRAAESGCIFTGPTRIRFADENGIGYMYVTSPDTVKTRAGCDGGDGTTLKSPATAQVTRKVNLTTMTDLVIYVQDVTSTTATDNPAYDYNDPTLKYYWEKQNRWVDANIPTCLPKAGTNTYPYVIPNPVTDPTEAGYFNASTSTYKGFPSEQADPNSPWYSANCKAGDLYVQGRYRTQATLATDGNVIITGSLRDSQMPNPSGTTDPPPAPSSPAASDWGKPSISSQSVLGIAAKKFTYLYRPMKGFVGTYTWASNKVTVTANGHGFASNESVDLTFTSGGATSKNGTYTVSSPTANTFQVSVNGSGTAGNVTGTSSTWVADWKQSNINDVILNFALLAITECFGSQDYNKGPNNGGIWLWGSLAQNYRCAVGVSGTNAFSKHYKYDDRLTQRTPPYMLELSDEPWGSERVGETTPLTQAVGASVTRNLLRADDVAGSYIGTIKLASAPDKTKVQPTNPATGSTSLTIASSVPGLVVYTYEVFAPDGTRDVRRLVILVG